MSERESGYSEEQGDGPHGLDGVGEDDLLVGVSFLVVVPAVVDELHLLQHRRLRARTMSTLEGNTTTKTANEPSLIHQHRGATS